MPRSESLHLISSQMSPLYLVRGILDVDGPAVQLEGRRQAVVVVDHVHGRLLVFQLEERLAALRLEDEDVGDQAETRAQFDDLMMEMRDVISMRRDRREESQLKPSKCVALFGA